jgi:hypothetical protein
MTGNPILKTGQVEQELGKLRGWCGGWDPPANTPYPFFVCPAQGFQSFSHQMQFRILLLPTENSSPAEVAMYLLSDSWPRFVSPSGSCGAEHPVFEIRGKKFCSSASAM